MESSKYWYGTVYSKHLYSKDLINFPQLDYAFIGPKHTNCSTKPSIKFPQGNKKDPHFIIYLKLKNKLTKQKIIDWFEERNIIIKYLHNSFENLEANNIIRLTKGIKQGHVEYYDFNKIRIVNKSNVLFDYREFFPHQTFTKTALKRERDWTDKCLTYLPASHERKEFNFQYGSVMSDVWSIYIIKKLEAQEPIKSILAKKRSPEAKLKRKKSAKKRQQTILNKEKHLAEQYNEKMIATYNFLPDFERELALILAKLQVLNHLAKSLQNWKIIEKSHQKSASKMIKILTEKYNSSEIYELKNQVLNKIFNNYSHYLKLCAYRPEEANKYFVHYCDIHNSDRHLSKTSLLDYLFANYQEIDHCPNCHVEIIKDYYACYNFEVSLSPNIYFNFHIPYPVGKDNYPNLHKLPKIRQIPNENGPYFFGRESNNYENNYAVHYDLLTDIKNWLKKAN